MSAGASETVLGPFDNWANAQKAARQERETLPGQPVTVLIAAGEYEWRESLTFGPEDSGTVEAPVVYKADGVVRLTGARKPDRCERLNESGLPEAVIDLIPAASRDRMMVIDIPHNESVGTLNPIPESNPDWEPNDREVIAPSGLIVDDQPIVPSCYPGSGPEDEDWLISGPALRVKKDVFGNPIGEPESPFRIRDDQKAWTTWKRWTDIRANGYLYTDWANTFYHILDRNTEEGWIQFDSMTTYGPREGQRFRFVNVLEEIHEPGTYVIDTELGKIFYLLKEGETPRRYMIAALKDPFIRCEDASHLTFEGFTIEDSRGSGIYIKGGECVEITGCEIRNLGHRAVVVHGGKDHHVTDCEIHGLGGGAMVFHGGDYEMLTPAGHTASRNHCHHFGRISPCYEPAVSTSGVGMRILDNHIHHIPHAGIQFDGNDHLIEGNEIHHYTLETGDASAIYSGRNHAWRGTIIRRNHIHHSGTSGAGGSMAIYLDDCLCGVTIEDNFFECVTTAIAIGGGRDHDIRGNVFSQCSPAISMDGRGMDVTPPWTGNVNIFVRDKWYENPEKLALYKERYRGFGELERYFAPDAVIDNEHPVQIPPEGTIIEGNINTSGHFLDIMTGWFASPDHLTLRDNLDCAQHHDQAHVQSQNRPQDQFSSGEEDES